VAVCVRLAACQCVGILPGMGVDFILEIEGRVVSVPDPSGGECNAAGDFDGLLPLSVDLPMLRRIDVWGEVEFAPSEMAAIVGEAEELLNRAKDGPERRGLLRLQALAAHGSQVAGSVLRARGD
jgi:hypothetical protein